MAACHHQTTPNPECHALETRCTGVTTLAKATAGIKATVWWPQQSVAATYLLVLYIHQTVAATNCGRSRGSRVLCVQQHAD
eukprot:scaffold106812_cov75-Phaeocystis_antarctica.AAC.1